MGGPLLAVTNTVDRATQRPFEIAAYVGNSRSDDVARRLLLGEA